MFNPYKLVRQQLYCRCPGHSISSYWKNEFQIDRPNVVLKLSKDKIDEHTQ